jgi:hypothetical protein
MANRLRFLITNKNFPHWILILIRTSQYSYITAKNRGGGGFVANIQVLRLDGYLMFMISFETKERYTIKQLKADGQLLGEKIKE